MVSGIIPLRGDVCFLLGLFRPLQKKIQLCGKRRHPIAARAGAKAVCQARNKH